MTANSEEVTFPIRYEIRNACKKSVEEVEVWKNESTKESFITETMWRGGAYILTISNQEEMDQFNEMKDDDEFCLDNFEDYELIETYDSCSEDYTVIRDGKIVTDEDDELIRAYNEDWCDALYERDFDSTNLTTTIYNGITYEIYEGD